MSDSYDNLLAGLEDEAKAKAPREPARASRKSPQRAAKGNTPAKAGEAAKGEQRGKRADPAYDQVNAFIRAELKPTLFFYLRAEGRTLSDLIEEKIEEYVEQQGGIITPKRRKKPA